MPWGIKLPLLRIASSKSARSAVSPETAPAGSPRRGLRLQAGHAVKQNGRRS